MHFPGEKNIDRTYHGDLAISRVMLFRALDLRGDLFYPRCSCQKNTIINNQWEGLEINSFSLF